jgi:hypothetical protein
MITSSSAGDSPQAVGGRVDVVLFGVRQNHDDDAWILTAQGRGPVPPPLRGPCGPSTGVNMVALAIDGRYPPPSSKVSADAPDGVAIGS